MRHDKQQISLNSQMPILRLADNEKEGGERRSAQGGISSGLAGEGPDDDEEYDLGIMKYFKVFQDRKRFAWALLSILKNNLITAPIFYVVINIEYLEMVAMYIVFVILFSQNPASNNGGFLGSANIQINSLLDYISSNLTFQAGVIITILTMDLILIALFFSLTHQFGSPELAKKSNSVAKFLNVFITIKNKAFFTIEIILLLQIFTNEDFPTFTMRILMFSGAVLCLILTISIEFIMALVFNLHVRLIDEIAWCQQRSFTPTLKSSLKMMQGVALSLNIPAASSIVLLVMSSISMSAYIYFQPHFNKKIYMFNVIYQSLLFAEYFHLTVASIDNSVSISKGVPGSFSSMVTILLFFLSMLVPPFANVICLYRQEKLQNSLLSNVGTIKSDMEIEKALLLFTECLEKSSSSKGNMFSTSNFALNGLPVTNVHAVSEANTSLNNQITGLILYHRERCREFKKGICFCNKFDDSLTANRLILSESKKQHDKNRFRRELSVKRNITNFIQDSHKKQNKKDPPMYAGAPDDDGDEEVVGLQSYPHHEGQLDDFASEKSMFQLGSDKSISRRMLLPLAREETVERKQTSAKGEKEMDWQQEEQKQFQKGILNPVFQAEFYTSQTVLQQKKVQADYINLLPDEVQNIVARNNQDLSILDFSSVKIMTVINILYKIIKDQCEQNPKANRLMVFRAYFELFVMRKKYLSHQTLTRMQGEENMGLILYTQFQLDQQYLVEKAASLYVSKDEQLVEVERIIQMNHLYQHFYDLNEETSFQLNLFWTQLSNTKTIDIEKLFDSGVKTSELIKLTKDKFAELISQGMDKRNSNLYYLYANFNKYVLNSNDLYNEYMFKMKQIQNMNKTLQDNSYKDQLLSDVDKSGFIIVRGTFSDFGKILYANHKLCQMLGYTPEQLNHQGKIINVVMPQLISEKHHQFLNIFRETGEPVFVQKQQYLFVKNASGYIIPSKCYIKFHYDKEFGHVFCGVINPVRYFHPFKNKKKLLIDEVMTIMTDDMGTICEISPAVTKYLGIPIKFVQQNQMFLQDNVKIWHLLKGDSNLLEQSVSKEIFSTINPDFHSDSDSGKPVYAAMHAMQALGRLPRKTTLNNNAASSFNAPNMLDILNQEGMQVDVKIKMAKMRHKDILTVRYFFIEILENSRFIGDFVSVPVGQMDNMLLQGQSRIQDVQEEGSEMSQIWHENTPQIFKQSIAERSDQRRDNYYDEGSSMSSDTTSKFADLVEKDIDQLVRNDRRTPKVLKQMLWLVQFAFLSTTIISAIIMGLFVASSSKTQANIQTLTNSLQRSIYSAQVMNLLRSLVDYNLGIESDTLLDSTSIWSGIASLPIANYSINNFLSTQITNKLDQLIGVEQSIEQYFQQNGIQPQQLMVQVINSQGVVNNQQQTSNVAINVLISDIINIVSAVGLLQNVSQFQNISFSSYFSYYNQLVQTQSLLPAASQYQTVSLQNEIYYVFENYVNTISGFNDQAVAYFLNIGVSQVDSSNSQRFLILLCLSISTLLITLVLVSPVTLKIRRQKYQVLLFFMGLDEHIIKQCCLKSTIFEDKFSSEHFLHGSGFDIDENTEIQALVDKDHEDDEYIEQSSVVFQEDSEEKSVDGLVRAQTYKKKIKEIEKKIQEFKSKHTATQQTFGMTVQSQDRSRRDSIDCEDIDLAILQLEQSQGSNTREHAMIKKASQDLRTSLQQESSKSIMLRQQSQAITNSIKVNNKKAQQTQNNNTTEMNTESNFYPTSLKTIQEENIAGLRQHEFQSSFGPMESTQKLQKKAQKATVQSKNTKALREDSQPQGQINRGTSNNKVTFNSQVQQRSALIRDQSQQDISLNDVALQDVQDAEDVGSPVQSDEYAQEKDNREQIQQKIKNISTQSQSYIFIVILILFLIITCYFIGVYVYITTSINSFRSSFYDLQTIHDRSICLTQLFFYSREDMITATQAQLSGGPIQGYQSLSMNQLWTCMGLEQSFTNLKRSGQGYLNSAQGTISLADSASLCDIASQFSDSNITSAVCSSIDSDVFGKGLSVSQQDMIKAVLIQLLDYFSKVTAYNATMNQTAPTITESQLIMNELSKPPFLEYLYSNEFLLSQVNKYINDAAVSSVLKYIDYIKGIQIGLFAGLQVILIFVIVYFFCRMFNQMKKDMLSSHLMIAMLPKHLLLKKDQIKIREFLMS